MKQHTDKLNAENVRARLKEAGLRPTKQRMELSTLLWSKGNRHITAEALHRESIEANIKVSLATIYNTLHQFTSHCLLREVVIERGYSYFDTNVMPHHHFFNTETGELQDIPREHVEVKNLPDAPEGMAVSTVDVIVRIARKPDTQKPNA